jgi:hypothetical protein
MKKRIYAAIDPDEPADRSTDLAATMVRSIHASTSLSIHAVARTLTFTDFGKVPFF